MLENINYDIDKGKTHTAYGLTIHLVSHVNSEWFQPITYRERQELELPFVPEKLVQELIKIIESVAAIYRETVPTTVS